MVSTGIVYLSWDSLSNPRSHGFYRFFAFESILILILVNVDNWFMSPLSFLQIISWILLLTSAVLAVHGFYMIEKFGQPNGNIENTTNLVKSGVYKYIRHPLYASLILFSLGVYFKNPTLYNSSLVIAIIAFLITTARLEEREALQRFGEAYRDYMKPTKMFIPYIF